MNRTTKIVIAICLVRVLTQRFWETFDNPYIFYIGLALFELVALLSWRKLVGKWKHLVDFFIGCVLFDLFKYAYLQPYEITYNEDIGFILSGILVLLENKIINVYKYVTSRFRKGH